MDGDDYLDEVEDIMFSDSDEAQQERDRFASIIRKVKKGVRGE